MVTKQFRKKITVLFIFAGLFFQIPAYANEFIIKDLKSVERSPQLSLTGQLHRNNLGGAIWYSHPLLHDGLISQLNDSFHLEAGVITSYFWLFDSYSAVYSIPVVGVRWDFHLTPEWTVFAIAKFGWILGYTRNPPNPLYPIPSIGAHWHIDPSISLRLETSHTGYLQAGFTFQL